MPRLTDAEMIAISGPTAGAMVFNTTDSSHYNYAGPTVGWVKVGGGNIMSVFAGQNNPADGLTYFSGSSPFSPTTTSAMRKTFVRWKGVITLAEISTNSSGVAGSNEAWSFYVRVNNTTDYLIATVVSSSAERNFTNTNLSIPLNSGDYFEIKQICPTWVTNPTTVIQSGYVIIK